MARLRKPLKCIKCDSKFGTVKDLISHMTIHKRMHIQPVSLEFYAYNFMKDLNMIGKYMKWDDFDRNVFPNINWSPLSNLNGESGQKLDCNGYYIYLLWKDANQNTCKNNPCDECMKKNIERTSTDARTFKYNREKYDNKFKRGFIKKSSGEIIPLP